MTAMLTARLVERGLLTWDSTLPALLPGVSMNAAYSAVTPIELLSHRAGLFGDLLSHPDLWDPLWQPGDLLVQRAWFAAGALALAPEQPVGTYTYSNAGYMVMGAALEARTGRTWEELLQTEVFDPLGATSCGFGMPAAPGVLDEPWGHRNSGGTWVPVPSGPGDDNPPPMGPAGTVHCSLVDWARIASANVAGARGDQRYLSTASWTRLHTVIGDDYALGWIAVDRSWAGGRALTHSGTNTMNYATVWAAPAIDRSFLVVANRGDAFAETDAVFGTLIAVE
jgi:CubicO group peptidase (beta-lactamase class C family)